MVMGVIGAINHIKDMDSEQWRRFFLRMAVALLTLIIGPFFAWEAYELAGLIAYVSVHAFCRCATAEIVARRGVKIANISYRYAGTLLFVAAVGNFLLAYLTFSPIIGNIYSVTILPLLLGGYEGSYWASFHGINGVRGELGSLEKHYEDVDGTMTESQYNELTSGQMDFSYEEKKSKMGLVSFDTEAEVAKKFQANELVANMGSAIFVLIMAMAFGGLWGIVSNLFAAIIVFFALVIPVDKSLLDMGGELKRMDRSPPSPVDYEAKTVRETGRRITGTYGIMQFSVANSMRIFAFSMGGVEMLAFFLILSEICGFVCADVLNRNRYDLRDIWMTAHVICLLGILMMSAGFKSANILVFGGGWCLAQAAIRGMTRGLEVQFANQYLKPTTYVVLPRPSTARYPKWLPQLTVEYDWKDLNEEIGLRERMKFISVVQYVICIILCYQLHQFIKISNTSWIMSIFLLFGGLMAIIGFHAGQYLWQERPYSLQQAQHTD